MPAPEPGPGEILVRVHTAAVTATELQWIPTWTTRAGTPRQRPIISGHEFSGVVEAVGPEVGDLAAGDAVFGMNDWYGDGAQAELCTARAGDVARKPPSIDHVLAGVTPISAVTAWQGLIERAKLAANQRVLVHGAAGSVGLFAVQLARWRSAQVIATAAEHNVEFVQSLGAEAVIDYRKRRFDEVVRDAFFIVEPSRAQLDTVARLIESGALQPIIGAVFPLAEARRAYEHKPLRGKVVLTVGD